MKPGNAPQDRKTTQSSNPSSECKHCGTAFKSRNPNEAFCCNGCEYVHHLIHHAGLDQFYTLKGKEIPPVGTRAFQERELNWLETLVNAEEAKGENASKLRLDLQGISCVGCVWLIEKIFDQSDGSLKIVIQPQTAVMEITWSTGRFDVLAFARDIQKFGYWVGPFQSDRKQKSNGLVMRIGLCGAFAMNAMLFTLPGYFGMESTDRYAWLFTFLTFVFASLSTSVGGSYFFMRSYSSLRRGIIHIDLPISLGIAFAYAGSVVGWYFQQENLLYFDFVSVFTFLMLVGRWTQEFAIQRNRNFLLENNPIPETVETNEGPRIPLEHITPGQAFIVKAGHTVPVNSQLISEAASVNLEWINGESDPIQLKRFQDLPSGAINAGSQTLEVRANETWDHSLMQALLTAERDQAHTPTLLDRILKTYLVLVLLFAAGGGSAWYWMSEDILVSWQVTLSILVVSCPCALGVAAPLADEFAAAKVKRLGVFIRNRLLWNLIIKVRHIVFDKTGTLTLEAPELVNQDVLNKLSPEARKELFCLVSENLHPKSRSLKQALLSRFYSELQESEQGKPPFPEEVLGKGIVVTRNASTWKLGRPDWALNSDSLEVAEDTVLSRDGRLVARFSFADSIREDAREELHELRDMGYSVELLSGDHPQKVQSMLQALDLPSNAGQGHQSPQQKARYLEALKDRGTLMVGDGANDSLAFDAALCCGTPVIEKSILEHKSDFFFMGRKLAGIRELFVVAQQHFRAQRDVFLFAVSYNSIAIIICLMGKMNPLLAAVLMPLSSLISLTIVALRLKSPARN